MASLDWSHCSAVESVPGRLSGAWVFKDTRMPVSAVFEKLGVGATVDEIAEWFHLTHDQIVEVLAFAARSVACAGSGGRGTRARCASCLITVRRATRFVDPGQEIVEARDLGWERLANAELLAVAEGAGFDLLLTAEKNIRYQQDLTRRRIALVVLSTPRWPVVRLHVERIVEAVNASTRGAMSRWIRVDVFHPPIFC